MIHRRQILRGVAAGSAASLLMRPLRSIASELAGSYRQPKRVVFVLIDNGLHESVVQPVDAPLAKTTEFQERRLEDLTLPPETAAFEKYKSRLTIIQGLRGDHVTPDHGAGFGALSGFPNGLGDNKYKRVIAESIDAAVARQLPAVFPLLVLGVDPGQPKTAAVNASSAWGPGRPVAAQCRPSLAFRSLFGGTGADQQDFAARKNLLDFVHQDVNRVRSQLAGPEREQLDQHLAGLEALSGRQGQLAELRANGVLEKHAPQLPDPLPETMRDVVAAQFDIGAAALVAGLTNVLTITLGLCNIRGTYTGFSQLGAHSAGHNERASDLGIPGEQLLLQIRQYMAEQTAELLRKLETTAEGKGTMLDNTLVVFTSDSANRQHSHGENWPFLLLGNLGGRIKQGRLLTYPLHVEKGKGDWRERAVGSAENPKINSLYCALLHAVGDERETFNPTLEKSLKSLYSPLKEILT